MRVQNVMDELNNERIDIIQWSDNDEEYIRTALAPAEVSVIHLNEEEKRASCYVQPEQRSLAIGRNGQNVRLASNLTKWELDIMDIGDLQEEKKAKQPEKQVVESISDLEGITATLVKKLEAANLSQVAQLKGLSVKDLTEVDGIGEAGAKKIVDAVKKVK